jgi:hypothetical protein
VKVQGREQVLGQPVRDSDGRRLGRVVGVQCAPDPYTVVWFLVALTGWRRRVRAVPAAAARWSEYGAVDVPFRRDQVLQSPAPAADHPVGADFVRDDLQAYYAGFRRGASRSAQPAWR